MELVGDSTREVARRTLCRGSNGPPGAIKTNAMAAANLFLYDNFSELRLFGVSPLGDDNCPTTVVLRYRRLLAAILFRSKEALFDLNGDMYGMWETYPLSLTFSTHNMAMRTSMAKWMP
jgi:hypothetical protein